MADIFQAKCSSVFSYKKNILLQNALKFVPECPNDST